MFNVQQIAISDYSRIVEIFLKTFPRTDDTDFATAWRTKECNYSLGLYHKATLVGFAITCIDAGKARIWFIAVDAEYRSAGAGTQLLNAVINTVQAANLRLVLTPDNNPRVISWYERHGFKIIQEFPFVHKDIPTYLMEWRQIEPNSPVSTLLLDSQSDGTSRSSFDSFDSLKI